MFSGKNAPIGILTFHYSTNYGAVLQAYSLRLFLKELGYESEIIDYRPFSSIRVYAKLLFFNKYFFSGLIKFQKFRNFINNTLIVSRKKMYSPRGLPHWGLHYKAIIVGSDEVWKVNSFRGFDPSFFLSFVDSRVRKISFAASMGGSKGFGPFRMQVCNAINQFHSVSARDSLSVALLESECNISSSLLLDPTLLINRLKFKAKIKISESFILIYGQANNRESDAIKAYSSSMRLLVVSIGYHNNIADVNILDAGVEEWLAYFENANIIFTNFFHGTIFGLKFKKEVFVLDRPNKSYKIEQLIGDLALTKGPFIDPSSSRSFPGIYNLSFSDATLDLINKGREKATSFVLNALSDL